MASRKKKVATAARRKAPRRTPEVARVDGKPSAGARAASEMKKAAKGKDKDKARGKAKGKGKGKGKGKKGPKKYDVAPFKVMLANGKVKITPKKGNRLARKSQSHEIAWEVQSTGSQRLTFELVFHGEEFEGAGEPSKPWPFQDSSSPPVGQDGSSTGPQTYFAGTLRAENDWTVYKYDVIVRDNGTPVDRLDPMIIIGKL